MPSLKNGLTNIGFVNELSRAEMENICLEVNAIYLEEEGAIWPSDGSYERINPTDLLELVSKRQLITYTSNEGQIIGTIVLLQQNGRWYFGLLTTHRQYRRMGIASQLIDFVENYLRSLEVTELFIEIIYSTALELPNKDRLLQWYQNMGFEHSHQVSFKDINPAKAKMLQHPSYFYVLRKKL